MHLGTQHHIAIISSDYDRAMEFYVNKLGFELYRNVHRPEQNDWLWMLRKGDVVLEIFIKPDAPQRITNPEALGLRHLAFRVKSVEEAVAWLASRGIQCEPIRMDPYAGCAMTFFHDPDGLPLELHE